MHCYKTLVATALKANLKESGDVYAQKQNASRQLGILSPNTLQPTRAVIFFSQNRE